MDVDDGSVEQTRQRQQTGSCHLQVQKTGRVLYIENLTLKYNVIPIRCYNVQEQRCADYKCYIEKI